MICFIFMLLFCHKGEDVRKVLCWLALSAAAMDVVAFDISIEMLLMVCLCFLLTGSFFATRNSPPRWRYEAMSMILQRPRVVITTCCEVRPARQHASRLYSAVTRSAAGYHTRVRYSD